ncbi:unnamed protein product [marine sediment metagenome]|uniref:Nudix hydrolase domain-containing protein n=1 Tax=marine sediment metagenome TaxID=412755 RepID=X0YG92_9ZZZZ
MSPNWTQGLFADKKKPETVSQSSRELLELDKDKPLFPAIDKRLYHYEYPMPSVVVDIVVTANDGKLLLLVERKKDPWKGCKALPGGFMEIDELIVEAAARELKEETGLVGLTFRPVGVYDKPKRDPRGRIISYAFHLDCGGLKPDVHGADDVENAKWFAHTEYLNLLIQGHGVAADHAQIIDDAIGWASKRKLLA